MIAAKFGSKGKADMMKGLLTCTAAALLLGLTPALAAENSNLPAQPGVSPDVSKQANVPNQGSADTSGGTAEQSSANPS
jgi:hypothetical protein